MILCCGEALIDMLPEMAADGSHVLRPVTGGSVFNTAIALGRLDEKVGFFSGISTDGFGRSLISDLEEACVDHAMCIRSNRPTTLAVVDLSHGDATYTFYDEGSAGRMIELDETPVIPKAFSTLLFGGISLIPEPCGGVYEDLLTQNSADHLTYLDPNIRPGFIDDQDKHRSRIQRMITHSDIVKVSDEDLSWIEPNQSFETSVENWLNKGTSIVLVSRGGEGSEAYIQVGKVKADAVKIDVADTVGAGDTFNAGFLASVNQQVGLSKGAVQSISESVLQAALSYANQAAAVTASRIGANPPRLNEMPLTQR